MPEAQYPFIDVAVHERVREAFAAGMAVALFTPQLGHACWANGRGAALFGHETIYDFLDQGPDRGELMYRQVEPVARALREVGDRRSFTIRVVSGFLRVAVQATCEMIRVQGEPCVLLTVPLDDKGLSPADRAASLIEGFDDPETQMAVLDGDGTVLAASAEFEALDLSLQTTRMLANMTGGDRQRLAKRPISTALGYLPAAVGRISESPALNLLFVVNVARHAAEDPAVIGGADEDDAVEPQADTVDEVPATSGYDAVLDAVAAIEGAPEIEEEISLETETDDIEAETDTDEAESVAYVADEPSEAADCDEAEETADAIEDVPADDVDESDSEIAGETYTAEEPSEAIEADVSEAVSDERETSDENDEEPEQTEAAVPEQPVAVAAQPEHVASKPADEATADLAPETPPAPRRVAQAVRFVWKIDAAGRFSEISKEFADAVGPHAADITGMAFTDLAALFNLDPDGKITELLGKRDTWSGKTIWWPVEGTSMVVPVDLAALPTYTRSREFDGFRGFGIVRLGDAAEDPHAAGLSLGVISEVDSVGDEAPTASAKIHVSDAYSGDVVVLFDASDEADGTTGEPVFEDESGSSDDEAESFASEVAHAPDVTNDRPADEKPVLKIVSSSDAASSDKVVSLSHHRSRLSPGEQAAFQEIGRQLDSVSREAAEEAEASNGNDVADLAQDDEAEFSADETIVAAEEIRDAAQDVVAEDDATAADEIADEPGLGESEAAEASGEAEEHQSAAMDDADGEDLGHDATTAEGDDTETDLSGDAEPAAAELAAEDDVETASMDEAEDEQAEADKATAVLVEAEEELAEEQETVTAETDVEDIEVEQVEAANDDDDEAEVARQLAAMMPGRERTELSSEIIDLMPVALLVHAGDRLIHANGEFLKLTGYASLDALDEVGGLDALLQRQELEDKTSQAGGMIVVRADDVIVPVTARLQSIRWKDTAALMLALMPVAASEQTDTPETPSSAIIPLAPIRTADQLAKLQVEVEELRAILETATDGVVIIGASGEVRSINRAASALFNFDPEEITGQPFVTLFAHESQRAVIDYLGGLSGHGVASLLNDGREVMGREASGGFLPLFMTIGRLTSSNGFCAVIRDITQWKRTEDELRTAKRAADAASAHKSEFLAHVSHEIRTPLNAIVGFADMMASERLGPVGHPRYVEYANDIGRSGRHVLDIVNDLLDISKIEAGELELDFAAIGLNETVSEAVSLVQPQANGQRVIIRTALSQAVPQVMADSRSIKQIVLNILSNAIRFTPSGGQIVVSTNYEASGSVVLRIRDTGIGMSRAELDLAMKPFRQVSGASRNRGEGTGLGLPLTKAMVGANRAKFNISSAPNEGTLVEVTFPPQRVLAD